MCRLSLLVLLLLFSFLAHGQNLLERFDSHNVHDSYDWRGFIHYEDNQIDDFEQYCIDNKELELERQAIADARSHSILAKGFHSHVKFVDLNNDQLADVIYTGPRAGYDMQVVAIFVREANTFRRVFSGAQSIFKIEWEREKLSKIYVSNWGCCADPLLTRTIYDVTYSSNNIPVFTKKERYSELRVDIEKPKSYLKTPIRFEVKNEEYKLRLSPKIDETTEYYELDATGNTIFKMTKGATGTAYGTAEDETGRVWWYVAMDADTRHREGITLFPKSHHIIGWLSSRYVTIIDEIKN